MRYAFTVPNVARNGENGILFGPSPDDPRITRMDVEFDPQLRLVYLEQIELMARVMLDLMMHMPATDFPEVVVNQANILFGVVETFDEFLDRSVEEHDRRAG